MKRPILTAILYFWCCFVMLGQDPQPDDPHKDQPVTCDNMQKNTHKCECNRAKNCPDDQNEVMPEDSKCFTYCRKSACRCMNPCNHTSSNRPNHIRMMWRKFFHYKFDNQNGLICSPGM